MIKFDYAQQNILISKKILDISQYIFLFEINPIFMISLFVVNAKYNISSKQISKKSIIKSFFCCLIYPFCYLIYMLIIPFLTCGADHRNFSIYNFTNCCPNCFYQKNENDPSSSELGKYSNINNIFFLFFICIVIVCLFLLLEIKFYSNKMIVKEKNKKIKLEEQINDYL